MDLWQYQFRTEHQYMPVRVGCVIRDFFFSRADDDFMLLDFDIDGEVNEVRGDYGELMLVAARAFSSSFNAKAVRNEVAAVRSTNSRRFVLFEGNGMIRICLSRFESPDLFGEFGVSPIGVTYLLTNTDMFDALTKAIDKDSSVRI